MILKDTLKVQIACNIILNKLNPTSNRLQSEGGIALRG